MVLGSILVDVICITISANKGGKFTVLVIPLIEIIIKLGIVALCAYDYFQRKDEQNEGGYREVNRGHSMQNQ